MTNLTTSKPTGGDSGATPQRQDRRPAIDMLNGRIWTKTLRFAIPVAATGALEQLFNATGVAIVGNFSGANDTQAVAAVGANSFVVMLVINLFIGISLGANVVIANAIGRGSADGVRKAVHTAIVMALAGGVVFAVLGELAASWILGVLNVPADVFPLALLYLRIYLVGLPVILLYNFEAAIFRATGDTATPLKVLAAAGVANIGLGLLLTAGFHLSVAGVATATVVSNAFSSLALLWLLTRTDQSIRVDLRALRVDAMALRSILRIGLPSGLQSMVFAFANVIIQGAINSLGTTVVAAYSAAFNFEAVAYQIVNSFSQACATFTGQNYGARKLDRCKRIMRICLLEDAVATAMVVALALAFGRQLLTIFVHEPAVIEVGYTRMAFILPAYAFSMAYEIMSGYLRGFGISLTPALLTLVGVCGTRLAWIAFVFPAHRDFATIMAVYPISLSLAAALVLAALAWYRPARRATIREV